jgi:hypothetical protein
MDWSWLWKLLKWGARNPEVIAAGVSAVKDAKKKKAKAPK